MIGRKKGNKRRAAKFSLHPRWNAVTHKLVLHFLRLDQMWIYILARARFIYNAISRSLPVQDVWGLEEVFGKFEMCTHSKTLKHHEAFGNGFSVQSDYANKKKMKRNSSINTSNLESNPRWPARRSPSCWTSNAALC